MQIFPSATAQVSQEVTQRLGQGPLAGAQRGDRAVAVLVRLRVYDQSYSNARFLCAKVYGKARCSHLAKGRWLARGVETLHQGEMISPAHLSFLGGTGAWQEPAQRFCKGLLAGARCGDAAVAVPHTISYSDPLFLMHAGLRQESAQRLGQGPLAGAASRRWCKGNTLYENLCFNPNAGLRQEPAQRFGKRAVAGAGRGNAAVAVPGAECGLPRWQHRRRRRRRGRGAVRSESAV